MSMIMQDSQIQTQKGIGLVEVLVALLLLSVAILGFSALQMRSIKSTDESMTRSRATAVMRGGTEMMRANINQINAFKEALNGTSTTLRTITKDSCTQSTTTAPQNDDLCTLEELAIRDALKLKDYAVKNDVNIAMQTCPGTTGAQIRQCMIASWGDTVAAFSDTEAKACAKENGTYRPGAECFVLEAY